MRVNHLAKKTSAILLLLCMIASVMLPIGVNAADHEYIAIAINEDHRIDLIELFETDSGALDYSSKQHMVELIVGTEIHLSIVNASQNPIEPKWASSNSDVASVSENGILTAIKPGTTTITATCGQISSEIAVTIVTGFELNHTNARLSINKLCNLDIASSGDLTDYVYYAEWSTTNESLALVGKGLVLASRTGSGEIVAYLYETGSNKQVGVAHCSIEVFPDITSVSIVNRANRLELGSTMQLNIKTLPERQPVIWESSDKSIATVDENGLLTATGIGTVTISAYAGVWSDNVYNKVDDIVSQVNIEVWSDATTKYNISVNNGARGEIAANKTTALAGETITVTATPSYDRNGSQIEAFGATALSVVDENGMAVTVTSEESGVFSFVMPKSPVSISAVYSSLYGVSCETALKANFARNNNLVGKLIINEFVGGSFSGSITFASPNVVLSNVDSTHGEVVKNTDGTITVVVDNSRDIATNLVFSVYADAQTIVAGSHSISVSGDIQMNIENSFVACTVGEFADNALIVDMSYVDDLLSGATLTLKSTKQIVIYGEALNYVKDNQISIELMFDDGSVTIPYLSLSEIEVEQGDFTVISMTRSNDVFDNEKSLGKYSLSARTYTHTGSSKNQMSMIGKVFVRVNGSSDSLLTLQTGSQTVSANKDGVFELSAMGGLETFTVLIGETGMSFGDVVSTILIVVLILALIVAVAFLLKRMQIIKHASPKTDSGNETVNEEQPTEEVDTFDEQAFKTVDEILRESNLSEELEMIRKDALAEMKAEVEREISEAATSTESLKKYENIPDMKELVGISSNDVDFNELESKFLVLSDTIRIAEGYRNAAIKILMSGLDSTTDIINRETDKIRAATSDMIQARESFESDVDIALSVLNDLSRKYNPEDEARKKLTNAIDLADEKLEQTFDSVVQDAKEIQLNIDNTVRNVTKISAELTLEMNTTVSYCDDLFDLYKRLAQEKSIGLQMLQPGDVYFSPEEIETKALDILSLINNMIDLIDREHIKSMRTNERTQSLLTDWCAAEKARIAQEREKAERVKADGEELLRQISESAKKYVEAKAKMSDAFKDLSACATNVPNSENIVSDLKKCIDDLESDEFDLSNSMSELGLGEQKNPQITEDLLPQYRDVLHNLKDLITSADRILRSCLDAKIDLLQQTLKAKLQIVRNNADMALQSAHPKLNALAEKLNPTDFNSDSIIREAKKNANAVNNISQKCAEMINRNIIADEDVANIENDLEDNLITLDRNLENANKSIEDFFVAEETKRIAERKRLEEEKRKEEKMRIEIERQKKIQELTQRRKKAIESELHSVNHKKLVEQFEDCIKLVANEHLTNMAYLDTLDEESKTADHIYLDGCSSVLYQNANEVYASNYWEMPDHMLSQLITAIKQDVDLIVYTRDVLMGLIDHQTAPSFMVQRLPRKKLRYWQNQMESRNPYIAILAMSKVENHKLRVKHGVIAHKANNAKR